MNTLRLVLLTLIVQSVPGQQTSPASVQGIILKLGTNEPVNRAAVELRKAGATDPKPYTVISTDDGKFTFQNVPAGQYQLGVTRMGYVPLVYGQRRINGPGETILIAPGQQRSDFRIV